MTSNISIAKAGKNAYTATDPNDFIFHSAYNTFKIIASGIYTPTITANSTETKTLAHGLDYAPLAHAFAKPDGYSYAILPNESLYSPVGSAIEIIAFNYLQTDITNITFNIKNNTGSNLDVSLKYFLFEVPL